MRTKDDITGKRYNRLTVIRDSGKRTDAIPCGNAGAIAETQYLPWVTS